MTVLDFDDFILWVTLGIILGGRTGYVLFYNFQHFVSTPLEIVQVWKGGMSFHGGFLGCVIAVVLFGADPRICRFSHSATSPARSVRSVCSSGGSANFVNGELWGRPADVAWAVIFPGAGPLPRHPSQLYEAALEGLVLFALLALLMRAGALKAAGN